jgi:hypothetical protein
LLSGVEPAIFGVRLRVVPFQLAVIPKSDEIASSPLSGVKVKVVPVNSALHPKSYSTASILVSLGVIVNLPLASNSGTKPKSYDTA